MLSLSGVSASYGSVPAITGINIEIGDGEGVGLLGATASARAPRCARSRVCAADLRHDPLFGNRHRVPAAYKITELGSPMCRGP